MKGLRDVSITWKLAFSIVGAVVLVMIIGFGLLAWRDISTLRSHLYDESQLIARIVSDYATADLAFGAREDARHSLERLGHDADIEAAALYDLPGNEFASWRRPGAPPDKVSPDEWQRLPPQGRTEMHPGHIDVRMPVVEEGERFGYLHLRIATQALDARVRNYRFMLVTLGAALFVLAVVVALVLQRVIAQPILHLVAVAKRITTTGDYSTRVNVRGGKEIAALAAGFDSMLGAIQQRELQRDDAEEARERVAEQLRQAQKLEAIGRLAAGIAHDFNNLLTAILSCTEIVSDALCPKCAAERPMLDEVLAAGRRAADLTRQLLAFSRQQVMEPRVIELSAVVRGLEPMLRRLIGEDIDLVTALEPEAGRCVIDPSLVEQMVLNLAVNSRDAMPHGGRLTLATGRVDLDGPLEGAQMPAAPGPYVVLSVTDTGVGMDETTRSRLFEPFFTTKPRGHGTGLGLATVYGIARQVGGTIVVESAPNRGSTFRILLPRTDRPADAQVEAAPAVSLAGHETILLVEDEALVRSVTSGILTRNGYRVIEAASGDEALRRLDDLGPIDLLLTDVIMPGVNGRQLADRVIARRPGLPVLFMSGYAADALGERGVLDAGIAFMQKPLTPGGLLAKVREVLDGRGVGVG